MTNSHSEKVSSAPLSVDIVGQIEDLDPEVLSDLVGGGVISGFCKSFIRTFSREFLNYIGAVAY
jgi:hypothetical protein